MSLSPSTGWWPCAALIADSSGNLYGTTDGGGYAGYGATVFEVAAGTHALTTLVTFNNGSNGEYPESPLLADSNGNLYGTTSGGGTYGCGLIFQVVPATHTLTTLVTFNSANGQSPRGGLIADANGNFFGTTSGGGSINGQPSGGGTVFEVTAGTHALTTLVTFTSGGASGANPFGGVIADSSGNLYGTTHYAGTYGDGTVFEVAAGTHALTTLAMFNNSNGAGPQGSLLFDAHVNLYGTTIGGGAYGDGTVFEVAAGTHLLTALASFNGSNGSAPYAGVIADANGNLYGTTVDGGAYGYGTVFELVASTHAINTLVSFNGTNGAYPEGALLADAYGNLYGTTQQGGANNRGTVFELSLNVPEPASLALLVLGGAGLLVRRRDRRT